jgi:hypothetical protein
VNTDIRHITRRQLLQALGVAAVNPALAGKSPEGNPSEALVNETVSMGGVPYRWEYVPDGLTPTMM